MVASGAKCAIPVALLSTHANRQGVDISITVCLCVFVCVFVCTVADFSAEDKASGVKFCTVVQRFGQVISHFGELCMCGYTAVLEDVLTYLFVFLVSLSLVVSDNAVAFRNSSVMCCSVS